MPFSNPVLGGNTLVREAIRSVNYVSGLSGWSINRDGSVEFASGTFRGPLVIVDSGTGNVLASIGATGTGSFQNIAVTNDILLGTVSLLDYIARAGRGIRSRISLSGALPSPGTAAFTNTAWGEWQAVAGRLYRVETTPMPVNDTFVGTRQLFVRLTLASPDGGFAGIIFDNSFDLEESPDTVIASAIFPATVTAVQRVQLQTRTSDGATVATLPNTGNSFCLSVEDIGSATFSSIGGSGTAAGASQFTKKYVCTTSRSFTVNGASSTPVDGDLYMGQITGRSAGTECAWWIFPGATIRADLSGATVQSARLFMYCFDCNDTGGDLRHNWRTNTALPATDPGAQLGDFQFFNAFPVPGWGSIDIIGAQLNKITVDLCNSLRIGIGSFEDPTAWRGFSFGADFRPYIEITYTK